ncbi:MAG: HNH endonuclease signature motif containing protein [Acidimicrobiales bacterium]
MQEAVLAEHGSAIKTLVGDLDASRLSGTLAARLASTFSSIENSCATGRAICAARVAETAYYEEVGHHDPESWLADVSGDSKAAAKDALALGAALEELPALDEACRAGELSGKKAVEVARTASLDPTLEENLLQAARDGSLSELRSKADALAAAARSKEQAEERHRRVHARRHLRTYMDRDGSFAGRFALTPEAGATLMGRISKIADAMFTRAHEEERQETREALLADALLALAAGGGGHATSGPYEEQSDRSDLEASSGLDFPGRYVDTASTTKMPDTFPSGAGTEPCSATEPCSRNKLPSQGELRPPGEPEYRVIMRIDLEALIRGAVKPGEICEFDGAGPVPVSVVQSFLDRSGIDLVVTKGTELSSIFSFKRTIPRALRTTLELRDRTCVVPGCPNRFNLEIDHITEFAKGGPTSLSNTCRLCSFHHRLKSIKGYRVTGSPGRWTWLFPDGTVAKRATTGRPRSEPDPNMDDPGRSEATTPPPAPRARR